MKKASATLIAASLLTIAHAGIIGFDTVTANSPNRESIAEQLLIETTELDTGLTSLKIQNTGPADSTIATIYFGTYLTDLNLNVTAILSSSPGVQFYIDDSVKASNPPGWNGSGGYWWSTTVATLNSKNPAPKNGINPYEYLELELTYDSPISLTDLILAGDVRTAMHVTSIGAYSDTFVTETDATPIPEPASAMLFGTAAATIAFIRRRFVD
jgi:hypothetical protein